MVELVLEVVPHALILPRVPIGTFLGDGSGFDRVQIMAPAVCVGCPPWPPADGNGTPGSLMPQPYGSMTGAWAAAAATRMAQWLNLLDAAFPGSIAGVHLAGLASGEMRFESPPEDPGIADYSNTTVEEFCSESESTVACSVPSATERCTPPEGNIFVANASAAFNLFTSRQVQRAISTIAAAAKAAMDQKGMVIVFYGCKLTMCFPCSSITISKVCLRQRLLMPSNFACARWRRPKRAWWASCCCIWTPCTRCTTP